MQAHTRWRDPETERVVLDAIDIEEPWALLERFNTLVRLSGSQDEAEAVAYLTGRLDAWGVPYRVHHPVCLISIPVRATLRVVSPSPRPIRAKTLSFSPSTDGAEITGELVYVPSAHARGVAELLGAARPQIEQDLRGKVVLTEGLGLAARGLDLAKTGAIGAIFINPGDYIHEGIATTSWGSPDLDSLGRVPPVPILAISRPDGESLKAELARGSVQVALSTTVDTGWRPIPVVVAEIPGTQAADEFVLFHGHLDSWHVGIGDNATGDATLLEIARVFWQHRERLRRTLRIAWWSGHSHGRYAGSTWYADTFAQDLMPNCIAHVNCDSPGCRWATRYDRVSMMAEASDFVCNAVRDVTGLEARPERPPRAGDCSFNNIGLTTFFMLSSHMPDELRKEKGYYPVGGCGGNIEWHTEADTLEIADRENLERDIRVYLTAILRAVNAPIHPYNFARVAEDFRQTLQRYEQAAGGRFDFTPVRSELDWFERAMAAFNRRLDEASGQSDGVPEKANRILRRLGRTLIPINFTRTGRFRHDPARPVPPLPDLAPAERLGRLPPDSDLARVVETHLVRGSNRVRWALQEARELVEDL